MRILLLLCVLFLSEINAVAAGKSTGVPRYDQAVAAGVRYLKSQAGNIPEKETTLVAYALVKAGEPFDNELIQHGVRDALERAEKGHSGYDHIYLSGVDALLLSEVDPEEHLPALQKIADYVASKQHPNGGWSEGANNSDTSMAQYGMLALWAAKGAGATISPEVVERNVAWHLANGTPDGSWGYRPEGSNVLPSHNLSMAGAGSMGIGRLLLHGPKNKPQQAAAAEKKFGVLEKVGNEPVDPSQDGFKDYRPRIASDTIDARITRAFNWIDARYPPPQNSGGTVYFPYYFFYALERAAALYDLKEVNGKNWFEAYGDVLLTMRNAEGVFDRGSKQYSSATIGTSFAILYFMRSTQQILDKQFGAGLMMAGRDPSKLFGGGKEKKKEIGPLDELLKAMEKANFEELENFDSEALVEKIQFGSKEELIGQVDTLKKLLKNPDPANRQAAYFALGRTGDFSLIPEMIQGLRDPSLDVNVEALMALRYIARKPTGFGISLDPLEGPPVTSEEQKLVRANNWRTKAFQTWSKWYATVRPYDQQGGLDELEALVPAQ
ncbi:MAG: hypothetical protein KDA81_09235 [Planctomycetaceae bacterium]|nr:hypothetical protein [Planctomycetaceae bacterium]